MGTAPTGRADRLSSEPTVVSCRSQDSRHTAVNRPDEFIGWRGQDREGAHPLTGRVFPVFPNPGNAKGRAVFHRDRVGLLASLSRLPFIERIDGEDAPAPSISVAESRKRSNRLRFGVDRLSPSLGIGAPIWNQTPSQKVERSFAGVMVLPDDEKFLARSSIPATRIVREPAVANVQPIDDRQPDWIGDLHNAPTHVQSCMPCVESRQPALAGRAVV